MTRQSTKNEKEPRDRLGVKRFREGRWDELKPWQFHPLATLFTAVFAVKKFFKDRGDVVSSSLAYVTSLSLVPLLTVFVSALAMAGSFDEQSPTLRSFLEQAFPAVASDAADYLQQFAQSSATSVGGLSLVSFLVVSIFLFNAIERAFNTIWAAPEDRSWLKKLLTFYFVITFGPILLALSVGLSARAQLILHPLGVDAGFLGTFAPIFLTFILFTLMHNLLPNGKVWKSASIVGGLFTALAFESAKWGFNLYVNEVVFESYRTIYGALGLLPVFLLWVYISWIIVLLGAELSYAVQNLRVLVDVEAAAARNPGKQKANIFNPLVGLEVLAPIACTFKAGSGGTPETELVRQLGYSEGFLRNVLGELVDMGAVSVVDGESGERTYLPAKQLDDIALFPVAEHFFDYAEANSQAMEELQRAYRESTRDLLRGKTALALVSPQNELVRSVARFDAEAWSPQPQNTIDPKPSRDTAISGESSIQEVDTDDDLGREPSVQIEEDLLGADVVAAPLVPPPEDALLEPPPPLGPLSDVSELTPKAQHEHEPSPRDESTRPNILVSEDSGVAIEVLDEFVVESSEAIEDDMDLADEPIDVSLEIDLGDDWDDFDVSEAYDDMLEASAQDLRETAELELEDADLIVLSEDRSKLVPPTSKNDL